MHRPPFSSVFKALPLVAAFFAIAADGDACHIVIDDNNDDEPRCVDLADVCPSLVCENGNVINDDGCPTCECADVPDCGAQKQAAPECANPVFDETTCSWFCDTEPFGCFSDLDCGPGFVCELRDCEAGGGTDCASAGVCIPAPTNDCFADADCGPGFRCDVNGGGTNGGAPAPPPDGDARPAPPPPPAGQCVPVDEPTCFSDQECGFGRHCEFLDGGTGRLVARPGVCVDDVQACDSDGSCAPGQVCQNGECVDAGVPCSADLDCHPGDVCVFADGTTGEAAPCFDADGDGRCDNVPPPPPQQGICVTVTTQCSADADCAAGETCQFEASGCDQPCEVAPDGEMICHPCDPVLVGTCRITDPCAAVRCGGGVCQVTNGQAECVVNSCTSNEDCGAGLLCNATDICLPPPGCDPNSGLDCPAVCTGFCYDPRATP